MLNFKLFVPCIFSTYGMKTNWCHYFICILLDLYMFRAHRPIFRRVHTAAHTTNGSYSFCVALFADTHTAREQSGTETVRTNGCVSSCTNSPEDGPVGPKHVETQQYTNKIVTSVGFHSIRWKDARYKKLKFSWFYYRNILRCTVPWTSK